jgi:acyl-CoA synthetase (AMP-forming)/AMP-acid ligase II
VSVQSPRGGLRTPETGLPRFLQSAVMLPDRPPLVEGAIAPTSSNTELEALVRRCAAGVAERCLGGGDVLAILTPNSPVWPVAAPGGQLAGGAVAPLDTSCTAEAIASRLRSPLPARLEPVCASRLNRR